MSRPLRLPRSTAFALALASASAVLAQTGVPELKPVPPALLEGNRLVLPDWNCSVAAPGDGWVWTKPGLKLEGKARSEIFVCLESATDIRLVFSLTDPAGGEISEKYVDGFLTGIRRSFEKQ